MKKTPSRLADGRQIIYFDESDNPDRALVDPREPDPVAGSSQLRFDPLLREWVVMAAHRQNRTHLPPGRDCPLCPGDDERRTEIPSSDYDVVVFQNRFPSLSPNELESEHPALPLHPIRGGAGRCEVIGFAAEHDLSFAQLSPRRVRTIVEAWSDRTTALSELDQVEQVYCFENRGCEIGVTLPHPHGQIYAYPFVPPKTRRMLDSAQDHRERTGSNLFADVLDTEVRDGSRIVTRSAYWTAFVPAAARWPVEVHLYPNRQVPDIPALTEQERDDFCEIYLDMLNRLDGLFDGPLPYVSAWHQAPVNDRRDLAYLHLELFSVRRTNDKLKYLAGSESGMGVFINDLLPEHTAARIREVTT